MCAFRPDGWSGWHTLPEWVFCFERVLKLWHFWPWSVFIICMSDGTGKKNSVQEFQERGRVLLTSLSGVSAGECLDPALWKSVWPSEPQCHWAWKHLGPMPSQAPQSRASSRLVSCVPERRVCLCVHVCLLFLRIWHNSGYCLDWESILQNIMYKQAVFKLLVSYKPLESPPPQVFSSWL